MPAENPDSATGSDRPLVTRTDDVSHYRRRLFWLLPDGTRLTTTIAKADDSDDLRRRIGAGLMAGRRLVVRGGEAVEE